MKNEKKTIRNTKQRKYMLELLRSTRSHPNAFWLYEKMKPQFPNLSLSTVYRNLGILEKQGCLQRLACGSSYDRYDANTAMHTHFYCRKCGRVYDIETNGIESNVLNTVKSCRHLLEGCSITFFGICEKCKSINNI
ncbi:MAG: transcriptional repressor [Eubacteriales bacterium]|nr:transcriptional repressor [Eubacteriales bacterium]